MNKAQKIFIGSLLTVVLFSHAAIADHAAIVYCALDSTGNNIVLVAADYSLGGGVSSSARPGRSCAAVVHEILRSGYEISKMDAPHVTRPPEGKDSAGGGGASNGKSIAELPNGLVVFLLEKTHK
jgi:hypothetical protein